MIVRQLSVVFLSLIAVTLEASSSHSVSLDGSLDKMTLEDSAPKHPPLIETKILKSPFSVMEIIEQGEELKRITSTYGTKTIIRRLDAKLLELLNLGVPPLDAAPMVNCFFMDAKKMVINAQQVQAYTLLNLLQIIYIWRDDAQFHWFQALSYISPWYDRELWNTHPMDWEKNLDAICECDNEELAAVILKGIPLGLALRKFNEEILALCAKHDSVKVFELTGMEPAQLKKHLEVMSRNSSAKLLRLYQDSKDLSYLHLEKYPFPEKLPASVTDFDYLIKHGHKCHPINKFIEKFCREGRLDLLEYLHGMNPKLIANTQDLQLAAVEGWLNILKYAHRYWAPDATFSNSIAILLAINCHFRALDWWMDAKKIIFDEDMIEQVASARVLEALKWIDQKQEITQGRLEWSDAAAEDCQLPALKWFYERFEILPSVESLKNATVEILEWVEETDETLINASLVVYGAGNFELLKWVYKRSPSFFVGKEKILSNNVGDIEMMQWLYKTLRIPPNNLTWAYKSGDLKTIQWAKATFRILPTPNNIFFAVKNRQHHIFKWIYELDPKNPFFYQMLIAAIETGDLEIANYLLPKFPLEKKQQILISPEICADRRLELLKWVHEHKCLVDSAREMAWAIEKGHLRTIMWLTQSFPTIVITQNMWNELLEKSHHEIYQWILKAAFGSHPTKTILLNHAKTAFSRGNLEIIKIIYSHYGDYHGFITKLSQWEQTRENCHIQQWLTTVVQSK